MKQPIRDQILWPLIALLLIAVAANAIFSAWWLSNRNLQSLEARQRQILGVLEESSFPLSNSVMEKLSRLTGDELVVWDSARQEVVAGTLPAGSVDSLRDDGTGQATRDQLPTRRQIGNSSYLVRTGHIRGAPTHTLYLLTSDDTLRRIRREAMWPPLAIGFATIVLLIPITLIIASRWARRIRSLESHVEAIADGEFGLELPRGAIDDELTGLVDSINSMSRQLSSMREQLLKGERTRLVAQLTAGFGHQLRNGLAGAKLAIQLHESRCPSSKESSLAVAKSQLALVEEEVQGLLALGKGDQRPRSPVELNETLSAVRDLVMPICEHQGVEFDIEFNESPVVTNGYADSLRAAILNLTLNAIEAAGPGGRVRLKLSRGDPIELVVDDDGPGPPQELVESLFESFVTSKPEGIGLGLTVAMTVAQVHHGSLEWNRADGRTRFVLKLPAHTEKESVG